MPALRSGQAGRALYQLGEVIKSGIRSGGAGAAADAVMSALSCIPLQDIPSTFEAQSVYQLPMTSKQFDNSFGQTEVNPLNILQANESLGVVEATSDFGNANQLAADFCLTGIGVTLEGDDENFVIPGAVNTNASNQTLSPDDLVTLDTSGDFAGVSLAVADWGTYTRRMAEDLADALQVNFTIAERLVVIDEPLNTLAACGTRKGPMAASRSDIDTPWFVKKINDAYGAIADATQNPLAASTFFAQNVRRTGLVASGASSTFTPDRLSGQIAKASYNDGLRHPIYTNDCTRIFDKPMMIKAGRPFNFTFVTKSDTYLAQAKGDATSLFGGDMPLTGFVSGAANFNEWNARAEAPAGVSVTLPGKVIVLKGGLFRLKVCFLGILLYEQALCDAFNAVCDKYGDACMLRP